MRGKPHSDETKAAVMAALLSGESVSAVARKYRLPRSTVNLIRSQLPDQVGQFEQGTRESLDSLLTEGLRSNLMAQRVITEVACDKVYLQRQTAADLASLYGKLADHAIQLLEAASLTETEP